MTSFYQDTDGGSDAQDGTTWALAKLTREGLYSVMSAGDDGWFQGAAADTVASARTLTSPGTITNPCIVRGVVDGTTNEPPILSDIAVTLPKVDNGAGGSDDVTLQGYVTWMNQHLSIADKLTLATGAIFNMINCKLSLTDETAGAGDKWLILENCILETLASSGSLGYNWVLMTGGSLLSTVSASVIDSSGGGPKTFIGVDFSALGTTAFINSGGSQNQVSIRNCKLPAVFNKFGSASTSGASIEVIASSDTSSQAADSSILDYEYEDAHGTIDAEFTAVRTGGADDGASGAFAYAMTPSADGTLESSSAALKSPWMSVWVAGGSQTLTVYISNDAGTDYNEDEIHIELYTPDEGDTAQHDQTFDPAGARLFPSTTAVTDDASTWGGDGAGNGQKMSATVTPGFEGWAYARLHLAKRQATPDTLFLDPKIGIS